MTVVQTKVRDGREVGYFNSYILRRIKENKNFIACVTGETGSGKSYSALREGEILDPEFDIRNVALTPLEFMALVNGKSKQLKRGSVIIYDEVQVTMGALDYQTLQAKLINSCLSTFRFKGFILILTSPFFQFINKTARRLFHSRLETVTIDQKTKTCVLKPFLLQHNQKTGKTYEKYLRCLAPGKGIVPLKRLRCELPSKELRDAYEEKRKTWSDANNISIARQLLHLEEKKNKDSPLTELQNKVLNLLREGLTIPSIADKMGVTITTIYEHISLIKKKGIEVLPLKEKGRVLRYKIGSFA